MENRPDDPFVQMEKVTSERFGSIVHDFWDLQCKASRWWVVTSRIRLVTVMPGVAGLYPHREWEKRPYAALGMHVARTKPPDRVFLWLGTSGGFIALSLAIGWGVATFATPAISRSESWPGTAAQVLVTLLLALSLERRLLNAGRPAATSLGHALAVLGALCLGLWTVQAFAVTVLAASNGTPLRGDARLVLGDLIALAVLVVLALQPPAPEQPEIRIEPFSRDALEP